MCVLFFFERKVTPPTWPSLLLELRDMVVTRGTVDAKKKNASVNERKVRENVPQMTSNCFCFFWRSHFCSLLIGRTYHSLHLQLRRRRFAAEWNTLLCGSSRTFSPSASRVAAHPPRDHGIEVWRGSVALDGTFRGLASQAAPTVRPGALPCAARRCHHAGGSSRGDASPTATATDATVDTWDGLLDGSDAVSTFTQFRRSLIKMLAMRRAACAPRQLHLLCTAPTPSPRPESHVSCVGGCASTSVEWSRGSLEMKSINNRHPDKPTSSPFRVRILVHKPTGIKAR